jgi:inorganic pyrophosphatase
MNLLKDIEPGSSEEMNVIVEINKGSKNKYEIDKKTGILALDSVLCTQHKTTHASTVLFHKHFGMMATHSTF